MPKIIPDLSRYDADGDAGAYPDGVILNIEDPHMANKAEIAHRAGAPVLLYSWVYPGDQGQSASRAQAAEELLAADGIPVAGHALFLDYEQAGVQASDLQNGLRVGDSRGMKPAIYTYAYLVATVADLLPGRFLWLAYYPGANDGTYPSGQEGLAHQWGASLWQFTSSGGQRDLSAVLDEAAWSQLIGGTQPRPPTPPVTPKETDMIHVQLGDVWHMLYVNQNTLYTRMEGPNGLTDPVALSDQCASGTPQLELWPTIYGPIVNVASRQHGKVVRASAPTIVGWVAAVV